MVTEISIRVYVINAYCKWKMCLVPNYEWYYYKVGCYYMADYRYDDPNKATPALA